MKNNWSTLSRQQIGAYAEYFVKMAFTRAGFQVYTSEVDDRGVDFVCRHARGPFYEIQVKSKRNSNYIFAQKAKFELRPELIMAVVVFSSKDLPEIFLIPSLAWNTPNALLVDRGYDGKKSKPEWGVCISKKNAPLLAQFAFGQQIEGMQAR